MIKQIVHLATKMAKNREKKYPHTSMIKNQIQIQNQIEKVVNKHKIENIVINLTNFGLVTL